MSTHDQIMTHKRYMVFAFDAYQAKGGVYDSIDSFDTPEEAMDCANNKRKGFDCVHVFDRIDGIVIFDSEFTKA